MRLSPGLRRAGLRLRLADVRAGHFDDRVEGGRVGDGQLAEHLAVQLDAGGAEGGDEAVVADAALPQGGAEARDCFHLGDMGSKLNSGTPCLPCRIVTLLHRQIVGAVTAVAVLLCGVVCACGASAPHSHAIAAPPDAADRLPPCHRHRATTSHNPGAGQPTKTNPCKGKGSDHSCPHCQPGTSPQVSSGNNTPDLTPLGHFIEVVQPVSAAVHTGAWQSQRAAAGKISPPLAPTLLRLHCALNT